MIRLPKDFKTQAAIAAGLVMAVGLTAIIAVSVSSDKNLEDIENLQKQRI